MVFEKKKKRKKERKKRKEKKRKGIITKTEFIHPL